MLMAPPPVHDSALLSRLPGFPPQAFPTTVSSLTSPQSVSSQSTTTLAPGSCHTPQTPAPSSCTFQGTPSGICMAVTRAVQFSFHLGCHRSAVSCSAFNVSLLTQTIAQVWGSDPCFSFPTCRGQVLLTLLFFSLVPLSYRVFCGSIYSFPLVRYSCLLSAGVLHALLCLDVYS